MKEEVKYTIEKIIKEIKAQGFGSVCFWLPTRSVGGGTYLFCELSKYIAENTDLNVYYLDCPDGYAHELIGDNSKIKMIDYESEDFKFPIKEPLIVFTNITRVIQIKKMNPKNKILLWHWETNPVGWGLLFLLNETKRLIKMLNKKNAVVFHDWSSANMLERQSDIRFEEKRYFPVRRIYYIYGVPEGEKRGFHSHKRLRQVYIAIHGSCEVMLTSGEDIKTIKLESPAQGLYIGNDVWREIYNFSTDAVLLVLASEEYSEDDYIRKYDKFIESVEGKK